MEDQTLKIAGEIGEGDFGLCLGRAAAVLDRLLLAIVVALRGRRYGGRIDDLAAHRKLSENSWAKTMASP